MLKKHRTSSGTQYLGHQELHTHGPRGHHYKEICEGKRASY